MTTKKVSEIAQYEKNPRKISRDELIELERDLSDMGDLSGIVHEVTTNQIISGNQRSIIFDEAEIVITEYLKKPTKQGTIARGYITYQGEQFSYRQVKWNDVLTARANIRANKAGGRFDPDLLVEYFTHEQLLDYGFDPGELPQIDLSNQEQPEPIAAADHTHLTKCPKCGFEFKT
jgi:hypothetical protein